jgi:signal transduction histidine kinase
VNFFARTLRQLGIDTAYVIVGFPVALAGFVLVFTLFVTGMGMLVTVVGIPIVVASLYTARFFADIERMRLPAVVHRTIPRPRYRRIPQGAGFWRKILTPVRDGQSWLDLLHAIIHWILGTVGFVLTVTWWSVTLGGLSSYIWLRFVPHPADSKDLNQLLGLNDSYTSQVGLQTLAGVIFLLTLPPIVRISALIQAQFGRAVLSGIAELTFQVGDLSERREAATSAEATALRRLERDIHDGPQQRLVRLAMDLGRARLQLDADPEAARATIDEALGQTRETLDELRALSRGIAPPILADRGLPSALAALAGRSTVPAGLTVPADLGRLTPATETTAYFVVAEALANVAKHSAASTCGVDVVREDGHLFVTVVDDGMGGAHVSKGHGLSGLADRVRAAGGTLTVTSPVSGPTEISAVIPCHVS